MLGREYTLKTRYNFRKVLNSGKDFSTKYLIIKYFKTDPSTLQNTPVKKKFGVITSNRFSRLATRQTRMRRVIYSAISERMDDFVDGYYYIFIPKKTVFDKDNPNAKIKVGVKEIVAEIDTFLSEMDLS